MGYKYDPESQSKKGGGGFGSPRGVEGAGSNAQESGSTYEGRDGAEVYAAGALRKGKGKGKGKAATLIATALPPSGLGPKPEPSTTAEMWHYRCLR